MRNNQHSKFILTPIAETLKESVSACRGLGIGIETQPLSEYVYQTTFLKMTGASEQKLKCICWEMATYDYEYRYKKLSKPLGECSDYDDKKKIFHEIIEEIKKIEPSFNPNALFCQQTKQEILRKVKTEFSSTLNGSLLTIWDKRSYANQLQVLETSFVIPNKNNNCDLLNDMLTSFYKDTLYRHRNRCAHNLRSYQTPPTLKILAQSPSGKDNYFNMFFVLILMDNIFMTLYKEYLRLLHTTL